MPRPFVISDRTGNAMGFPQPRPGLTVRDRDGRIWQYRDDQAGLSDWVAPVVSVGGSIGGQVVGGMIGGAAGGPIGAGIGLIASLIAGIFGAHAAKVKREDEISGAWAKSGPAAISAVMEAWRSGQAGSAEAIDGLRSIEAQFMQMTAPIVKTRGKFGQFPDPEGPRPSNECNWACGTYWDLHQEIKGKIAQIQGGGGGGFLGMGSNGLLILGLAALFLMRR